MANGWDSYYQNLSSDQRPLRTTESEGSFSQQIENFIGQHDFTSTVASHASPSTTTNFNENCFSNPGIGNSSSDCVYQRYYTESSWQADGQPREKDCLPQCENKDVPDFATDGLLPSGCFPPSFPADPQGIKQECGMLTSSFLEDYSDVSNCLDTDSGETRSSCNFIPNNSDQKPKTHFTTNHSLTEWLFSHPGSTAFPTESLPSIVAHTNIGLLSSSNEQDEMKNPEKTVVSTTTHDLCFTASNIVTPTGSEILEDGNNSSCKDSKQKEEMDRGPAQGKHLDIVSDHKNQTDGKDAYPVPNEEEQTASNVITTFHSEQQYLRNNVEFSRGETEQSFNREREGSNNCSTNSVQVGAKIEDYQDKTQVLNEEGTKVCPAEDEKKWLNPNSIQTEDKTMNTDCKEKDIKMGTFQSLDLEDNDDKTQDNHGRSTVMVTHDLSDVSDKNRKSTSTCSLNPSEDSDQTSTAQIKATSSNMDCNGSAATNIGIVGNENKKCIADYSKSVLEPKGSSTEINLCLGNGLTEPTGRTNTESSFDLESSGNVAIGSKNDRILLNNIATHSQLKTSNADIDPFLEEEGSKKTIKVSSVDFSCSGSRVIGNIHFIDNSDKNKQDVADAQEVVLQTDGTTTGLHSSFEKDCTGEKNIATLPCTDTPYQTNEAMDQKKSTFECSDPAASDAASDPASDRNEQSFSSCVESCSELNNSNIIPSQEKDMINSPERETATPATKSTTQKLLDQNLANLKPQRPDVDFTENARQSFEELGTFPEEQSVFDMLYGEPLSREDSSCDTDKSNPGSSQYKETTEARTDRNNVGDSKGEEPQLDASRQMRNLQPVVILKALESANERSNLYYCATCKHTASSVKNLIEHHHDSHSVLEFQFCKSCDAYLMRNKQAEEHLCGKTKDNPRPSDSKEPKTRRQGRHKCNRCNLFFSKLVQYVRHMRTHTGKTPYRCNNCGVYFAQGSTLQRHKSIPGRCKPVKLPVASHGDVATKTKTPPQKDVIKKTLCLNLPECYVKLVDVCKTNLCTLCNKIFSTAEKTKNHIKSIHKKEGVAVSPSCEIPTEEDEDETTSKYKCPLCPRLFKYSYNRARHLRDCVRDSIYNCKEKVAGKYPCPLCHATFTLSSNRYRHIKAVCLRQCLNQLAKERAKSRKKDEQKTTKEMEQKIQTKEEEQKNQVLSSGADPKTVRRYKCNLCPATFSHASGKYKHQKKHELFKLTGKAIRYRNSAFSISKPANSTSTSMDNGKEDTNPSDIESSNSPSCHFCGKCFSTSHSLKKHERSHRGERPYRCLECKKGFKKLSHLICHKIVHQRRIQCTVCKKILPTVGELIQHRTSHHNRGKLQCPDCDQQFQYPVYLLRHLDSHIHRANKALELEMRSPQQQLESIQDHSEEYQLQCSLCKEEFDDAQVLRKHCLTHISRSSSHQCPFCKHNFNSRRYLLRHMIKHTGDKPYSCENCGKQFYRDLYLKLHSERCCRDPKIDQVTVQCDTKTKTPYQCSYCPRSFCKKMRLKNHHQGHKQNSLALCSRCGQYFGLWKLNQHQKDCVGTTDLKTGSSNDKVNESISQANHNVHKMPLQSNAANMLQLKCPHCTQRFRYRSLLLRHMVTHTGLQPYPCLHCSQRFPSQGMCLQHEVFCDGVSNEGSSKDKSDVSKKQTAIGVTTPIPQAEGQAEYKCKFCTKTFTKSRKLRYHILTHNEVKPYRCKACDSCFSRYDHLKVHQTRCKGKKTRLEVCIPKISIDDIGRGWQNKFGLEPGKEEETFECEVCARSFTSQSKLSRHNTMFHVAKLFKCSRCGSTFSHEKTLKRHRKLIKCRRVSTEATASLPQHPNPMENMTKPVYGVKSGILERIKPCFNKKYKYVCSYCPRAFEKSWQLSVHTRLHTGEKPFACDYCGQRFIRKDYVQRHYPRCSKKQLEQVFCDQCGGPFSKVDLENHKKHCFTSPNISKPNVCQDQQSTSQSPPRGFSCAYCSSRFLLFSQLQEHFLNAHKLETLAPPVTTASLQHHLSNIAAIKEEPLDESCDEWRSQDANLTSNFKTAFNSNVKKLFVCPECKANFASKSALMAHLRGHAMKYPFICKTCKKGFWNRTLLRNHHRKCRFSPTSEKNASSLLEGPLKAEIDFALVFEKDSTTSDSAVPQTNSSCEDDLLNKLPQDSEETLVQSNPSKEKKAVQYQCSECDESFTDGLVLISHLEEHGRQEQEKRLRTCFKCGFVCASQFNLENHMKVHGGAQKYSCSDCSKVFYTASAFKIHRTYHDAKRPFVCKLCNQRFWTKRYLRNHFKDAHPSDVFSCRFCDNTYSLKRSLQRHYKQWHQKEYEEAGDTLLERGINATNQVSTPSEHDDDESDSSGDSDSDTAPYFPCHVCSKTFSTSESLEDHQRCHLGEKPHECEECGKCFFQASQLQQHQRMHKSEFQCQMCGRGFVSLFALRKHKHSHGKSRPYRCSKCHLSFPGHSQLAEHMSIHQEENFPCDICNRVFHSKSSRAEHRKSHSKSPAQPLPSLFEQSLFSNELKYRCGVCGDRFRDPEELSEHGCMATKERLYSCSDCNKHFLHASHLKKHKTTYHLCTSNREYACNKCQKSFSSSEHFLNHLKTHSDSAGGTELNMKIKTGGPSNGFICPVCHQCFASAAELCSHFPTHPDHMFECKTCKILFPSRSKLNEHERHHLTSSTEFDCHECGQSFLGRDAFRHHDCSHQQRAEMENEKTTPSARRSPLTSLVGEEEEVDVTGECLYNCPVCSMQFSSQSSFLEHQNKAHLNEKPFKCELCGKSFPLRRYLRRHEQRHRTKLASERTNQTQEKLFKCTQCHTQFTKAQDLSVHMRIHSEQQFGEYRCDMCYKSFNQWQLLKAHQESHVGEVVYECTECDKAFAFPHLLEKHQQTHAGSSH
ncbi:zinc finger protein 1035 [Betta splendens]|uniref:Zinc finger protein 1035 n=1 Tax=Betta splendens TaxID=158456 RepID=A0A9W2XBT1_BETSP|nr:zinc finger protein 1035 [Betta splendens]